MDGDEGVGNKGQRAGVLLGSCLAWALSGGKRGESVWRVHLQPQKTVCTAIQDLRHANIRYYIL